MNVLIHECPMYSRPANWYGLMLRGGLEASYPGCILQHQQSTSPVQYQTEEQWRESGSLHLSGRQRVLPSAWFCCWDTESLVHLNKGRPKIMNKGRYVAMKDSSVLPYTIHNSTVSLLTGPLVQWLQSGLHHWKRKRKVWQFINITKLLLNRRHCSENLPSQGLTATAAVDPATQPERKAQ